MAHPGAWLKSALRAIKLARENDSTPPPPPYCTDWPRISAPTVHTAANYSHFQRLPLEIRRHILAFAFGDRTLHIDLTFDHPLTRKSSARKKQKRATALPAISPAHCGFGVELVRDPSQPKQWQWFSCVCHRRPVRQYPGTSKIEPHEDGCIAGPRVGSEPGMRGWAGLLCLCEFDPSLECFIGVMGWLRACRQA
jgi:hypothetical protein